MSKKESKITEEVVDNEITEEVVDNEILPVINEEDKISEEALEELSNNEGEENE